MGEHPSRRWTEYLDLANIPPCIFCGGESETAVVDFSDGAQPMSYRACQSCLRDQRLGVVEVAGRVIERRELGSGQDG